MMIGRAASPGPVASLAQDRTPHARRSDEADDTPSAPAANATALVPQTPRQRAFPARGPHNDAAFITHLLATAEQVPQTRTLRRAAPQDAMADYRAAMQATGPARSRPTSRLA